MTFIHFCWSERFQGSKVGAEAEEEEGNEEEAEKDAACVFLSSLQASNCTTDGRLSECHSTAVQQQQELQYPELPLGTTARFSLLCTSLRVTM